MLLQIRKAITEEAKNDESFIPKNVNLDAYLLKIEQFALFHSTFSQNMLYGFVAFYANDSQNFCGFITMIIVSKQHRGKGVAKNLINSACNTMQALGMKECSLEVLRYNLSAINLYKNLGFNIVENKSNESVFYMKKILTG